MISIQFYTTLRHFFDISEKLEFDVDGKTLSELLAMVDTETGKKVSTTVLAGNKIKQGYIVLINSKKMTFADITLKDGDMVEMLSPSGGGV